MIRNGDKVQVCFTGAVCNGRTGTVVNTIAMDSVVDIEFDDGSYLKINPAFLKKLGHDVTTGSWAKIVNHSKELDGIIGLVKSITEGHATLGLSGGATILVSLKHLEYLRAHEAAIVEKPLTKSVPKRRVTLVTGETFVIEKEHLLSEIIDARRTNRFYRLTSLVVVNPHHIVSVEEV